MNAKATIPWVMYAGLTAAMVGGARWPHPQWPLVALGVAVLVAAGVWKRRVDAGGGSEEGMSTRGTMGAALDASKALPDDVRALAARAKADALPEVVAAVEALLQARVEVIAAAQEDVVRRRGFEDWAALMGPTAAAERLLNRAWSAGSDGHREETERSLGEAVGYAEEAAREAARIASASGG
jgi:hypothetical protein